MLAKPLKASKKISIQKSRVHSSGLNVSEKALSVKALPRPPVSTKTDGRKVPIASAVRDDSGYLLTHVIDMLTLSTSEGEPSPLERHRKCTRKSPSPKARLKSSGAAVVKGSIL
jgi:hypothetical protein